MAERMVVITHKDGRRVAVTPHDFKHAKVGPAGETYEALGWKVERWEDGAEYEEPKKGARGDG